MDNITCSGKSTNLRKYGDKTKWFRSVDHEKKKREYNKKRYVKETRRRAVIGKDKDFFAELDVYHWQDYPVY